MSETEPDGSTVREVARAFGIDLSTDDAEAFAEQATGVAAQFAALPESTTEDAPVEHVTEGDDEYNAFRYQFSLDSDSGPLSGLRLAVKDNIAVAGVPMTCGSDVLAFTPMESATVVRRLVEGGASLVGTTNMDDFAYFTTGETCAHGRIRNPRVEGCVPGGSSSGNGAAVAAGLVDAALGSDTGGSIRIPASFCGVVGLKPTHRSVSRAGFVDLSPSLDHVGPLADSVSTAARVFDAVAGPDARDPSTYVSTPPTDTAAAVGSSVDGLRVGVVEEAMALSVDPVAATVREAVDDLADAGADVERVSLSDYETTPLALLGITGVEFASLLADAGHVYGTGPGYSEEWRAAAVDLRERGEYGDNVREQLVLSAAIDEAGGGSDYVAAQRARAAFVETVRERFEPFDALVTPTTPIPAPEFGAVTGLDGLVQTIANTGPFNLTGHPALSVPCGETEGKPVGLQVVADWHDEPTAVALASAVEGR